MSPKIAKLPARRKTGNPAQTELKLPVEAEIDRDELGMGVLNDGTPFLHQRAIGDLCGVRNKYIGIISSEWNSAKPPTSVRRVKELLYEQGVPIPSQPHIELKLGGRKYFGYPDTICMAMLEYYAFEADLQNVDIALQNYRQLARFGLRKFIYEKTGYSGHDTGEDLWRIFKDRVSLTYDAVPTGFFGVFKEVGDIIVTLGMQGLHIDSNFVPDISVGQAWSKYWEERQLSKIYGDRGTYQHNYPDYFPQSVSNPQLARCYPEAALGEFRKWCREEYIGEGKFSKYLSGKVAARKLPSGYVERAMLALTKER